MGLIRQVKKNSSSGVKFVTIPKKDNIVEGDLVNITKMILEEEI